MHPISALLLALVSVSSSANEILLSPNAPRDQPKHIAGGKSAAYERAIAPYVERARLTYPNARARFLAGLPEGQVFFITTRLPNGVGGFEQVFVLVESINDGRIHGQIANDIIRAPGYKRGDAYTLPESELIDWLISKPDGSEEGNFVGKFLDTQRDDGA